jgi:predicted dehydrogenase
MLARLAEHEGVRAVGAWDPSPASIAAIGASGLRIAASAEELIGMAGIDCVYVASPPDSHLEHANRAFDAGLPVFCEKPLAVDFEAARRTIARIEKEGLRGAVNFSLASSAGLAAVQAAIAQDGIGRLQGIEIEVAFARWPRPWQSGAGRWLAERREGGFTREVLSHFIFVLQRVLGQAAVEKSAVAYPKDGAGSETGLSAELRAGGVAVRVSGSVGGGADDFNRFALVGERGTIEFREWLASRRGPGSTAFESSQPGARPGYLRQLDQLAAFVEGKPHVLPGFAEALAVQETIEAMLSGTR